MPLFTAQGIATILNTFNLGLENKEVINVSIDSRACSRGSLFIGLKGQKVDGGDYLDKALQEGAAIAIIALRSTPSLAAEARNLAERYGAALFFVSDPLYALQSLARYHIARFPTLIKIAITGSSGKTTVKEMVASILREVGETTATFGNLNSDSGLPLSCFSIEKKHRFAVLEMGMNRQGEIDELANIFKPHYAIITNIGTAHIGLIGSQEMIAREKKAIFNYFDGSQSAFIPQEDDYASFLAQSVLGKAIFYAPHLLKYFERYEDLGLDGYHIYIDQEKIRVKLSGKHNLLNACLAISLAQELGINTTIIKEGLEKLQGINNRSQVIRGRIIVIKDCYNANPQSMAASIDAIKPLKYARKVVFLAEMRELGDYSGLAHASLAPHLMNAYIDAIFLLGSDMIHLSSTLKQQGYMGYLEYSSRFETIATSLISYLQEGDLLLLKGSRYHQLERIIKPLEQKALIWPDIKKENNFNA